MRSALPLFLAFAAAAAGCSARPRHEVDDPPPIAVQTARAERSEVASTFEAGGVVRARLTAAIASRVMAPILTVHVRAGDRVRAGTPLVTLDARELTSNRTRAAAALTSAVEAAGAAASDIKSAEAAAVLARTTHDRVRTLHDRRSATTQELDQATASLDAAEAQLAGAKARAASSSAGRDAAQAALDAASVAASYAILTAPFDAIVIERSADPGSMASPGVPLLTIEDRAGFRLEVPVDEARAGLIRVGATADVRVDGSATGAPAPWTTARIVEIARVDPAAHNFLVKLDLPEVTGLRSGEFGRARFNGPSRRALTIPAASAVRRGQLTFVFAVDDHERRARLQPVSPGAATGDRLEVLAGLDEGATFVVDPPVTLSDGMRVREGDRP